MNLMDLAIRPALKQDAAFVAEMIQLSMGHLAEHLFEADHRSVRTCLENLLIRNAGRFGVNLSFIAESAGKMKGALLSFHGAAINRLNLATVAHLFPILGVGQAFRFMWRGVTRPGGQEAGSDEYYISNLGVLPSAQGQGVGAALLRFAEGVAQESGLPKTSLVVGLRNQNALRLYRRSGYQVVETVQDKNKTLEYHRMVKKLS